MFEIQEIEKLSKKILLITQNIGMGEAISWNLSVYEKFKKSHFKELPLIKESDFDDLKFDPQKKIDKLNSLKEEINTSSIPENIKRLLKEIVDGWILACMIAASRNSEGVYEYSKQLFGSPGQLVSRGVGKTVAEVAQNISKLIENEKDDYPAITSTVLKHELEFRSNLFFDAKDKPEIHIIQNMESDAAVGSNHLFIRKDGVFNEKDIDVLFVHELQTHVACELNGQKQPIAKWLSIINPRAEGLQEGLAAFSEFITDSDHPLRVKKIINRTLAIEMAENGASFIEVFNWFREEQNQDEKSAFINSERIFKGCPLEGGYAFVRDLSYLKNLLRTYIFVGNCIQEEKNIDWVKCLYNGYNNIGDIPLIMQLQEDGIVKPPKYYPEVLNRFDSLERAYNNIDLLKKALG